MENGIDLQWLNATIDSGYLVVLQVQCEQRLIRLERRSDQRGARGAERIAAQRETAQRVMKGGSAKRHWCWQ